MVKVEPHHSDEALAVLKKLGLCMADSAGDHFMETIEKFRCEHYFVAAMPGKSSMSLANSQLFFCNNVATEFAVMYFVHVGTIPGKIRCWN